MSGKGEISGIFSGEWSRLDKTPERGGEFLGRIGKGYQDSRNMGNLHNRRNAGYGVEGIRVIGSDKSRKSEIRDW